jgi:RNA polymerase sigma-70 factor (ECF subfamily)
LNFKNGNTIAKNSFGKKDDSGFNALFNAYYKSLCFYALKYVQSEVDAEDIVQEAFIDLHEKKDVLNDAEKKPVYLYITVKNKSIDYIRKNKTKDKYKKWVLHNQSPSLDEEKAYIEAEFYREIMTKIDSLPEKSREIFKLSYLHDKKVAEIAELLDVSVNTVKTHKMRAKDTLRKKLRYLKFRD